MGGSEELDLIVVGAGPAGAAAAAAGARLGLRTALLDKARFPRDKLCGGGVTGRARREFRAAFGRDPDPSLLLTATAVEFWSRGRFVARRTEIPPLDLCMRRDFDRHMVDLALAAGARDFTGTEVESLDPAGRELRLRDGRRLRFGVLVGADGVNSFVARTLHGRAFDPARIGFALEIEHPEPAGAEPALVRIDFGVAEWGYGWTFPKRLTRTVGLGGVHARNPDLKARLAAYLDLLGLSDSPARVKGQFLPFGHPRRRPGRGAVLLAGDAAGLVDPITGEGIAYALESGRLAAEAARDALARGRPESAADLHRRAMAPIRRSIAWARALRPLLFAPRLAGAFEEMLAASGSPRSSFMELLAGEIDYPRLLRRRALRLSGMVARAVTRR